MLVGSFRLVTARLIPGALRPKQPTRAGQLLLAVLVLAGCGGTGQEEQPAVRVAGTGFAFRAPGGWSVEADGGKATARHGSELVQVATFRLLKPYRAELFDRVAAELSTRMGQVAAESGGKVSGRSAVEAGGTRSHAFEVSVGDHVDEYTFVLRGRREYQLLCRRKASGDDAACRLLLTSFATT